MRCYLIAVAEGSAFDVLTNNISLHSLVEEVAIAVPYPVTANLHVVVGLEVDASEVQVEYELQITVDENNWQPSNPVRFFTTAPRHRIRILGLTLPAPGRFHVRSRVRRVDTNVWTTFDHAWPLHLTVLTLPVANPAAS